MEYAHDQNITNILLSILGVFLVVSMVLVILHNITDLPILSNKTGDKDQINVPFYKPFSLFGTPAPNRTLSPNSLSAFFNTFSSPSAQPAASKNYQLGDVLNSTADLATNVLKGGLDITNGGIHLVGNLINKSIDGIMTIEALENLDTSINSSTNSSILPSLDKSTSSIQNPANPNAPKWCYIGEHQQKRGCAEIANGDFCPGDTYDNYETCSTAPSTNLKTFLSSVSTRFSKNKNYTSNE